MTYTPEQLRECPFCGKKPDLDDDDTLYPSGTGWLWDVELGMRTYHNVAYVPREQWCWGMHCPTNSGGCGCEVHGDSKEAAIEKWNRRAHAAALERLAERDAENAVLRDAINDALPWMIKLGDYIGNGTQADPMGRCNAILKMRIAVEKRDD